TVDHRHEKEGSPHDAEPCTDHRSFAGTRARARPRRRRRRLGARRRRPRRGRPAGRRRRSRPRRGRPRGARRRRRRGAPSRPGRRRRCARRGPRRARPQRQPARAEPAALDREVPARGARARLRRQRVRAAAADTAAVAVHGPGRPHRLDHVRRRRRAVRGLGRLRLLEGRSRAMDESAGRRTPRSAGVRRRSRRHAHPNASGRVPGRGHLRPSAPGGERPRPADGDRGRSPERPLRSADGRAGGADDRGGAVSTLTAPAFELPDELIAESPPEARGIARDDVRMLVASRATGELVDTTFRNLPDFVAPGDLLVVNTSATVPAAVGTGAGRGVHFSTALPDGDGTRWVVEVRRPCGAGSLPDGSSQPGDRIRLHGGGAVDLVRRFPEDGPPRLWVAVPHLPAAVLGYLARYGRPIRYGCTELRWPIDAYQTAFGIHPGSAEMPSASRGFTPEVVTRLVTKGVGIAPITLHTGVSSQEAGEPPYAEWYRVPAATAERVNAARDAGHAVVAIGTTPTRALETVAGADGRAHAGEGWTDVVVTPERGVRLVDGLLTGWHEAEASHLQLLEAVAGRELLDRSYDAALELGYRWHEFGDLHLIAP